MTRVVLEKMVMRASARLALRKEQEIPCTAELHNRKLFSPLFGSLSILKKRVVIKTCDNPTCKYCKKTERLIERLKKMEKESEYK